MDLLNMTNWAQIHEFYKKVRPKKQRDMGYEYHYSNPIYIYILGIKKFPFTLHYKPLNS